MMQSYCGGNPLSPLGEASKKKTVFFFRKTPKGGGRGLAKSEISLSEKTRPFRIAERGGGGAQNFGVFLKKKTGFFLMPPLIEEIIFEKLTLTCEPVNLPPV